MSRSELEPARYPRSELNRSIVDRFEDIATRFADRVAVGTDSGTVSYGALNAAANAIAHTIVELLRDGPEPVGLLLDTSDLTISALLGVLKAGKFYVPLDPSYPADRLSFIVGDCAPRLLITDARHMSLARTLASHGSIVADVVDLHRGANADNPPANISPDDLAAVFYTSGSTGGPKGVMQSHRVVLHRVMVHTNMFGIGPTDRVSLLTSPGYSMSLRPLFSALLNGATVCPFDVVERGIADLPRWLQGQRITTYSSVPTLFCQLATLLTGNEEFDSLRVLEIGGERVTAADFALYKKFFPPSCVFVNSMGSNETGILRMYIADSSQQLSEDIVPVGYEVEDKHVTILDDDGTELGPGQVGEIAVRSEFLAPGYWRRPELTAAAFLPDSDHPGHRVYRTGDLGTMSVDGCLTYRGRKDFRMKVRGIRIEPDEIETVLRSHAGIEQTVVVAPEDARRESRLVAYIVPKKGRALTVSELRAFLSGKLPAHMVPTTFVYLDALPLTPNGKLDRSALPPPSDARPLLSEAFVAPRSGLERKLTRVCEELLGIRHVGVEDNLFDLGVDSLTMLRLTARIETDFERHFPPAALFASPTIAHLADALRSTEDRHEWSSLFPVQTAGSKPPFFWIHGDASTAFLSRFLRPDQPLYGLEHQGQDGRPAKYQDVHTIAAYYLRQIRTARSHGPYVLGGYSFGGIVALEVAQHLTRLGEHVMLLALLDPPSLVRDSRSRAAAADTGPSSGAVTSLRGAISRHTRHVAGLSVRKRAAYLWPRAVHRLGEVLRVPLFAERSKTAVYRVCLVLGRRLPVFVRSRYILDVYRRAREGWEPQPYHGRTILFKGAARRYGSVGDWEQLITGDLQVHVVTATHTELRKDPHVGLWAEQLKAALDDCYATPGPHVSASYATESDRSFA